MNPKLQPITVDQLVEQFAENGLAQSKAVLKGNLKQYNKLYKKMDEIDIQLRERGIEARRALRGLYNHPNPHVRVQAAKFSYGAAPAEARKVLENVRDFAPHPFSGDAGMSISALDNGTSQLD